MLFVLDALTFLAYVGVLAFVHDPGVEPHERGEAARVLREPSSATRRSSASGRSTSCSSRPGTRCFTLLPRLRPRPGRGLSERQIGAIFFFNTLAIVLAQLPISRWIEGRRRMRALALMPLLWAVAWLLVDAGGYWLDGDGGVRR